MTQESHWPVKPTIGTAGGQEYPVLWSNQTFLRQMAEGGARSAPTVLKELLQNADDAGVPDLSIIQQTTFWISMAHTTTPFVVHSAEHCGITEAKTACGILS